MRFTDDDLKRLKEQIRQDDAEKWPYRADIAMKSVDLLALLARLKAAEVIVRLALENEIIGHGGHAYEAWRKAAGEAE